MSAMFHTGDAPLVKDLLFIDGFTRAGKFFLGKIVAGLKGADYYQCVGALEHIPFLHRLGGITEDAALALFRKIVDENAYNYRIGRNLNTRFTDASSVYNSPEFGEYLRRSTGQFGEISLTGEQVVDSFRNSGRWSVFVTHENLPNAAFLFKAYPGMRMLNLLRHPVDVSHSWYMRGWGRRFGGDPLSFTPALRGAAGPVPWHAHGDAEYERLGEADRVIRGIAALTHMSAEAWAGLEPERRARIRFVRYEDVVERTAEAIEGMCAFLGTEPFETMPVVLARERCPGRISLGKREEKAAELKAKSGKESYDLLLRLAAEYESRENPYQGLA